jgi:uncharacterized protein YdbL (DUF1318 family)
MCRRSLLPLSTLALVAGTAVMLAACVTINVYFPAAEAKEAARAFVEKVIQPAAGTLAPTPAPGSVPAEPAPADPPPAPAEGGGMALQFDAWSLLGIGRAEAQAPQFTTDSPAVKAIQARIEARFDSTLRAGFTAGALGFSRDGLVAMRDAAALPLAQRAAMNQAVADDNRDRKALYQAIAAANGHPEWEAQIRSTFAQQWIAAAQAGWWVQNAAGAWVRK